MNYFHLFALISSANLVFSISLSNHQNLPRSSNKTILSDAYFYGQSPAVPSKLGSGLGDWKEAYAKATALVATLSIEEKVTLTGGVGNADNACVGKIPSLPRVGFPGLCLHDSGNGVRGTNYVNAYSSGVHVGASWNKRLAYDRARHMGLEFRVKGINVALGPAIGGLGRVALGGRNWESFSNDPYLAGQLGAESVKGIQKAGVIASTKHLIANEQEAHRNKATNDAGQTIEALSSNLDDKTLHEYYLWPFYDAVKAGTGNVMCSFNRVNNSYACQNSKLLNGILKTELGFEGFVVSDWLAQHAGYDSAVSGLDMAMPLPFEFWGSNLTLSVQNGSMPASRLDDMATRILATWYKLGQDSAFPKPGIGMPFDLTQPHLPVDARNPASDRTILKSALEGHVLVKNTNNALPLKAPKLLSIYGYDAVAPKTMFPEPGFVSRWNVGFENSPGNYDYFQKANTGKVDMGKPSQIAANGTMFGGGGAGAVSLSYLDAPLDALQRRAYGDRTTLFWDFETVNSTSGVDANSDACLVFINAHAAEVYDRPGLHDDFSDAIVLNIAAKCNNTIVVIHNAGIRLVDRFADHPNVTAIVFAHLPGQDSGRALVSLLYGDENFSGKLPYTVAKNESDYGTLLYPSSPEGRYSLFPQSDFSEGVFVDYRAFDRGNITPRYEFGFGLSYTTFEFSNLVIVNEDPKNSGAYPIGSIKPGGRVDLWDHYLTVTAEVANTGQRGGQEVCQLYLGIPGAPVKQLRGFEKVSIKVGETKRVEFKLTRRDLSVWDTIAQEWKVHSGKFLLYVGNSSRNVPLLGDITL